MATAVRAVAELRMCVADVERSLTAWVCTVDSFVRRTVLLHLPLLPAFVLLFRMPVMRPALQQQVAADMLPAPVCWALHVCY